jgi:predicted ATPase/class 3 adenylate cyclase
VSILTSTFTFLFTDIEGSTRLWELYPETMNPALARHDAILRQSIEDHQGLIVKTTGDGCHAVFETAAGAIAAALDAQRALSADPWKEIHPQALRVRMGVHTGEAEKRAGDYYGPALNRAARLMSIGHGGQVLISASAAELARDILPFGMTLLDLGEHRLKDLVRPEHIFQLVHPDLPASFPPIKSLDAFPNNLPIQITSFIGREGEIDESKRLLSTARLVTFTGSGGTGKTRLAQQVAAEALPMFTDGVWLVELAPLTDPDLVLQTVAGVLEMRAVQGIPLLDLVTDYLRGKSLLLILDNCEHLIGTCAELADHLLRACPALKILASSREGLGIAGEVTYHVPSLSLPDPANLTPDRLLMSEAVQLFLERAGAVNPHFSLTEANAPAIAQICRRLDGIPLALELAAARLKLFSAEQIASRLNDRFRLLTGGSRTALPRQQTLRALIDWSYDLLSEPERALLRQLSVFVGGWAFDAADAVCSDLDVLSLLEMLVNKSLVVMEEDKGQARYNMLETIRQYARDKLIEAGEAANMRDRHLDYFLQYLEEAETGLRGGEAFEWFDLLEADYDNIRAATEWGQEQRPVDALLLVGNIIFYWTFRADDRVQALHWLNELLTNVRKGLPVEGSSSKRVLSAVARGQITAGLLLMGLGDYPAATAAFEDAIALERELGDRFWLGFALGMRASQAISMGDVTGARAAAEESLALMHDLDDKRWLLLSMPILAGIEYRQGNKTKADKLRLEISQVLDKVDHPLFMPSFLGLGLQARIEARFEDAQAYFHKGLEIAQRLRSKLFVVVMESELAHVARERGDLQGAKDAYRRLIWKWKDFGQNAAVAHQLECFAFIARHEGEAERAARLLGAAEALRDAIGVPMLSDERIGYEQETASLRDQMDAGAFATIWTEGRAMDLERAISYAVSTTQLETAA